MPSYYIIFGAAVRPGGLPSGALRRRVEQAFIAASAEPDAFFLVTGGVGLHGPSEARVMTTLLVERGIPERRILLEEKASDTLESAVECARILRDRGDAVRVHVCTSSYHVPRCRLLMRILGIPTRPLAMPSERLLLGRSTWSYHVLRETAAIVWDGLLLGAGQAAGGRMRRPSQGTGRRG